MEHPCFVGIDVSKAHLDVYVRPPGESFRVNHDDAGFVTLIARMRPLTPTVVVLEATGGYEVTVAVAPNLGTLAQIAAGATAHGAWPGAVRRLRPGRRARPYALVCFRAEAWSSSWISRSGELSGLFRPKRCGFLTSPLTDVTPHIAPNC